MGYGHGIRRTVDGVGDLFAEEVGGGDAMNGQEYRYDSRYKSTTHGTKTHGSSDGTKAGSKARLKWLNN